MKIKALTSLAAASVAVATSFLAPAPALANDPVAQQHVDRGWEYIYSNQIAKAKDEFVEAHEIDPNPITLGFVAFSTFVITQGGVLTVSKSEDYFHYAPASEDAIPMGLLYTCHDLRKASAGGSNAAKMVLDNWWTNCATYGDRLYLDSDNVIRIKGTGSGTSGLSQGHFIF